jgi:phage tail tape-measure protein
MQIGAASEESDAGAALTGVAVSIPVAEAGAVVGGAIAFVIFPPAEPVGAFVGAMVGDKLGGAIGEAVSHLGGDLSKPQVIQTGNSTIYIPAQWPVQTTPSVGGIPFDPLKTPLEVPRKAGQE